MTAAHQLPLGLLDRRPNEVLKEKAHLAFLAYEAAMRDGDKELAEAARQRFIQASEPLAHYRRIRR